MSRLVLATKNPGKILEIKELLKDLPIEIVLSSAFDNIPDILEDGETFQDNAIHKAQVIAKATGEVSLADDSGLEVNALSGRPGVYSARFSKDKVSSGKEQDKINYKKVLSLLKSVQESERGARFKCVIALSDPLGKTEWVEGICNGSIGFAPEGTGGFGYDPIFIPDGYKNSFAALPQDVKNTISHRALALKAAFPVICEFFRIL